MSAAGQSDAAPATEDAAFAGLLDALPHAAWLVRRSDQRVSAANRAAATWLGWPRERIVGAAAHELVATPEDLAYWADAAQGDAGELESDTVVASAGSGVRHVTRSIRPLADGRHCLVLLRDRGAEQRAESERETLVAELQSTLQACADGLLVTDLHGRIRTLNQRFVAMWALPPDLHTERDEAVLSAWLAARSVDPVAFARRLQALRRATRLNATDRIELADGQVFERVSRPLWAAGRAQGRVWSYRDRTEQLAAGTRLQAMATTDPLTGLANRRRFCEQVATAALAASRGGGRFALLVIDLDRFRHVNDSLGHETGDRLLVDTAARIRSCLRRNDLLARIGGDQFALLVDDADAGSVESTARRVLGVVAQPSDVDGAHFTLTCSIGMVLCPAHGDSAGDLLRHAEAAMRAAKRDGRAVFRLHQARAEVDRRAHLRLDHAMRQALVSNRFRLHYQPQMSLADGRLVGAEALLRWRDPELGDVSPAHFIPVAEETGFIVPLGDWVLAQAVRQAAEWHERGFGGPHPGVGVPVAVNVSALQFQQADFVDRVAGVLAVSGLPPRLLELELTESILVHDADGALRRLHALAELGVKLAIDDFGTGYSSLAYLKRFPIGKLKIDRSFVAGLPREHSDAGIVRAILQMARALGMAVVAEGVETEAQRDFLQQAGCDQYQGFLQAPALDPRSFESRLLQAGAGPAAAARGQRIRLVSG